VKRLSKPAMQPDVQNATRNNVQKVKKAPLFAGLFYFLPEKRLRSL
jgi:hypothetical protein